MRVYIVVKDETDYNGSRTYPKTFKDEQTAQAYCEYYEESDRDWALANDSSWIPTYYVETSELID